MKEEKKTARTTEKKQHTTARPSSYTAIFDNNCAEIVDSSDRAKDRVTF